MKVNKIIEQLSADNARLNDIQSRRNSLLNIRNIAITALPAFLMLSPKKAKAATTDIILDVLNYALTLEYLEQEYYVTGVSSGIIPLADINIFNQIKNHEVEHVSLLQATISALGSTPVVSPEFDFTAGGLFDPFGDYPTFLALSQAFEDTGVRAYKGRAGDLISSNDYLTVALQIHAVEARHASEIRRLRRKNGFDDGNKGWIEAASRGTLPVQAQPVYDGEDNIMQGGLDVSTITTASVASIQEAFDEPLSEDEVLAIAGLFIV